MSHASDLGYSLTINRSWYVAELEPKVSIPEILAQQMNSAFHSGVRNFSTGETPSQSGFKALYNAIPWSFLIDYFTTMDMVIDYHTNVITYGVPRVSLMAQYELKRTIDPHDWPGISGFTKKPGWRSVKYKRRKIVVNPTVRLAFEPWITGGQAANLVALATSLGDFKRHRK